MLPAMKSNAFEIGFDSSGAIVDHSEVLFDDLPGTLGFERMLEQFEARVGPQELALARQQGDFLKDVVGGWVRREQATETLVCGRRLFKMEWGRPLEGSAMLTLSHSENVVSLSLLLSRDEREVKHAPQIDPEIRATLLFTVRAMQLTRDDEGRFNRATDQIHMTRRPLVASVYWPPVPQPEDDVRTAQRMIAYAFFKAEGVIA